MLVRWLERRAPAGEAAQLHYGVMMLLAALPAAILPALAVERSAAALRNRWARKGLPLIGDASCAVLVGTALKPLFALRMLVDSGATVRHALERDDLPAAREALGSLVSRKRDDLDAELVAAAAVESLAENLSDSVVAPLLAYALFGLPGAACYRLVNTMDAMIGYRGHYEHLGKSAARLDDVLNLIPSRLTTALLIALAPLYGGDARGAWRIWRRDASATASPNAGQPMAAAAGALGVQLEKVGHYRLGDARRPCTAATIRQAEKMVWRIGLAAIVTLAGWSAWLRSVR
jgi:adenosylcobinamide-phosphate synthase